VFDGIGLDADQEMVYLALLDQHAQTLEELVASHGERPRSYIAAAAESLVDKGLATRLVGDPVRYAAIAPDIAIESLVQARIDGARRVHQTVPQLMQRFWAGQRDNSAVDFVEIISGGPAIWQRWCQLERAVSTEVRAFERPPYYANPTATDPVELERLAQGISYRVIYDQDELDVPGRWADIERSLDAGEQSRVLPGLPTKLTCFDDLVAMLPIGILGGQTVSVIVIHRSPLLDALLALFEAYWEQALPLRPSSTGQDTGPGHDGARRDGTHHGGRIAAREERLIRLLVAGAGDEAIQRSLGVSASTVQRAVHDLMRRVGARTRFQAGVQIGRQHSPPASRGPSGQQQSRSGRPAAPGGTGQ
jgi:DNA-binding CsgD family transcriptional regulator